MSTAKVKGFQDKKTPETGAIEAVLRRHFPKPDAYRYNSASIRVRVVDDRFKGKSNAEREEMVSPYLDKLPADTQADITMLLLLATSETGTSLANVEFNDPSASML